MTKFDKIEVEIEFAGLRYPAKLSAVGLFRLFAKYGDYKIAVRPRWGVCLRSWAGVRNYFENDLHEDFWG